MKHEARSAKQGTRSEWACFCKKCRNLIEEKLGHPFNPLNLLTDDVLNIREDQLIQFLREACEKVKKRGKRVTVCLLPFEGERARALGIAHWEKIASLPIDILATDPYWIHFGEEMEPFVSKWAEKVLELSSKSQKEAQIWVQLFRIPRGREEEIREGINLISSLEVEGKRVDSIFGWPYRAGKSTALASEDPEKVWKIFAESLREMDL